MTVRDLINGALRLIGVAGQGDVISGAEAQDALFALNDMIESWSAEGFVVFKLTEENFNLIPGQGSYSIGLDVVNNFVSEVPLSITSASILENGFETPLKLIEQKEYSELSNKSLQGSPAVLFFNRGAPSAIINIHPAPSSNSILKIYSHKKISGFTSINDEISLPPGYPKALRYNLSVELAPEYEREASTSVQLIASESKSIISRLNESPSMMVSDAIQIISNGGQFNIYKGG